MIVEKRGESKVFEGVLMCLGEKLERENLPRNCPKTHFCKMRGLGSFIVKKMTLWLLAHLVGPPFAGYPTDISSFGLFSVQLWTHIWRSSWTRIELILVSLERSRCIVSKTLKKLKIKQSDQNSWPREACWRAFHDFLDISIVLTSISTHE